MSSGATEIKHGSLLEVTSPERGAPEHDDLRFSPVDIYINTISWICGNVAVHMRKVDNPRIMVVVMERFIFIATK